jgi:YfiH family protein
MRLLPMSDHSLQFIRPAWPAPENVNAVATTRLGGFSVEPFDGLNLAAHVGDDLAAVEANRALLQRRLDLPSKPCWLNQTHSNRVTLLSGENDYEADSDSAISRKKGQIAVVMTADCLPILLCSQDGSEVAAIHAGWRGLVDGIVSNTVSRMRSSPSQLMAWIGPAISQQRFEVGEDVFQLFVDRNKNASGFFHANRPQHWLFDLPGLTEQELSGHGVNQVCRSGLCSYDDAERFYSYRRDNVTGRMASLIWINDVA